MTKHHVFISYSRKDAEVMERVKETLDDEDINVWTDTGIVYGTPNWQVAIEKAIEDSACVVCILTPDAKGSRWVREELVYATFYEKPVYMVHARGDNKSVAILGFTVAQEVDVRDMSLYEPRMDQLVKRIKNHMQNKMETAESEHIEISTDLGMTQELPDPDAILSWSAENEGSGDASAHVQEDDTFEMLLTSIPPDEQHQLIVKRGKEHTAQTTFDIDDTFLVIGRSEKSRILINDPSVSREHLQLIFTADGLLVRDLDSTNGTFVNAERVRRMRYLKPGDNIQVGLNVSFVYRKLTD